ncbi:MAG: SDR family oxidoreductase [Bacteroidetes bacterium]|nr:SDR family oxidoreductase [Bacteroidota bacterium]MCH8231666.1 SDR family oxidoreductase [Bacteroidota bacterium]
MKNIVITGVSTGIGLGCTRSFIKNGFRVFGSVRKQQDADRLREELGSKYVPLVFDVTDHDAVISAAEEVRKMLGDDSLAGLINNAGISVNGPLMHIKPEDLRYQFEVNVFAQLAVTQAFLPMLGATKDFTGDPGKIMMMSSVSGRMAFPFLGPYTASKFALEGLSDTLRIELQLYGIKVIILEPGPVKSEIWNKVDEDAWEALKKTDYLPSATKFRNFFVGEAEKGIPIDDFGETVFRIFSKKDPKTRYVIINNKFKNWTIPNLLPDKILDKMIAGQLGLKKK